MMDCGEAELEAADVRRSWVPDGGLFHLMGRRGFTVKRDQQVTVTNPSWVTFLQGASTGVGGEVIGGGV
jgi:hypothetical protein